MYIGLDVGNGSVAMVIKDGEYVFKHTFASVYGVMDPNQTPLTLGKGQKEKVMDVFSFQQRDFVLGYPAVQMAKVQPIGAYDRENRLQSRPFQTLVKLALLDAVTKTGHTGVLEVHLCVGTPAEDFTPSTMEQLRSWFKEPVSGAKNGAQVVVMVKTLQIISQPIAALMDVYLDADGYVSDPALEKESVLVLDCGSGTLDMSEFSQMELVKQYSEPVGLNDVYQGIIESIQRTDPKVRVDPFDLEAQLRAQDGHDLFFYEYGPLRIDVTDFRERAMQWVWERMVTAIQRRYPDRLKFHRILLAGGTGQAFAERFREWTSTIQLLNEAQLAIANGLCKYALSSVEEMEVASRE